MDGKAQSFAEVVDSLEKTKEDSLPPVSFPASGNDSLRERMHAKLESARERMRAKLKSEKYSEETKLEVKGLIEDAVKFLLNREARSLPKAVKRRYLLNVKQFPRKLLQYPDIADALDLPVIRERVDADVPTDTTEKEIEKIEGAHKHARLCLCLLFLAC